VDFRLGKETETYRKEEDALLRRLDKHPNTQGALDLGLDGTLNGLEAILQLVERKQIRAMWIAFHPQLVGDDAPEIFVRLEALIRALEFSVVSTTHRFSWAANATILLPMAAWSEETGTYTNYAGRVQITNRAVAPPGDALPLHTMMAVLLGYSGIQVSPEPAAILEWIAREIPLYAGLTPATIGPMGIETVKETVG
jgi:predicted molibdopterin-dependent oxidoreductase YjgC